MGDVVDLAAKRLENSPHTHGPAICLECKYAWEAVVPVGLTNFTCPKCGTDKGVRETIVVPGGGVTFVCNCGNDLFVITLERDCMCCRCGNRVNPYDIDGPQGAS